METQRHARYNDLPDLTGLETDFETPEIMRCLNEASRSLAELKGFCEATSGMSMFMDPLLLLSAQDNAAIASMSTSTEELYKARASGAVDTEPVRSVLNCKEALCKGYERMNSHVHMTRAADIEVIAAVIGKDVSPCNGDGGFSPAKMEALEEFINYPERPSLDPLIKMALIYYHFQAMGPLKQGNGRTGRTLSVLYLVRQGLLPFPLLNLNGYIRKNMKDYVFLLEQVTEEQQWFDWVRFILKGVHEAALSALGMLRRMSLLKAQFEQTMRQALSSYYKEDMLLLFFKSPYFRMEQLREKNIIPEKAAVHLLKFLMDAQLIIIQSIDNIQYFKNYRLLEIMEGR